MRLLLVSALVALLVGGMLPTVALGITTAGPEYGTGTDGGGTYTWTNFGNVSANDNANATRSLAGSQVSNTLWAKDLGFAIPEGSTVTGIKVEIGRYSSIGTSPIIRDNTVQLTKDGSAFVGDNKAVTGTNWPTSEAMATYGSSSDLWGETWSASDINDADFGVGLRVTNTNAASRTANVDYIRVSVTYTSPGEAFAGSGANDASAGDAAWTNVANITAADGVYAEADLTAGGTSQYLNASDFGLALPADANINGITAQIHRVSSGISSPFTQDHTVQLMKAGARVGDNKAATGTDWPTTAATATYGGTTDTWGTTWTAADINSADFGLSLRVSDPNSTRDRTASVDYISIQVEYDQRPTCTVNQAAAQADPASSKTIVYDVTFNKEVTGLTASDFQVGGSATGFSVTEVSGSGANYTATVTGAVDATDGTIEVVLPESRVHDLGARDNKASTSTDNNVTYDGTKPTVTVNQNASQNDPTASGPMYFDVTFSEPVVGLGAGDFTLGGTATGFGDVQLTGGGTSYLVTVNALSPTDGTVTVSLAADAVTDTAGNGNEASTSTDNEVTYDGTAPVTTHAADPEDPDGENGWYITRPSITLLSDPAAMTFYKWDDAPSYTSYMLSPIILVPEGEHTLSYFSIDTVGNWEDPNTVDFKLDLTAPSVTVEQGSAQVDPANAKAIDFDVTFDEDVTGIEAADFTVGGTATGFEVANISGSGSAYVVTVAEEDGATASDGTVLLSLPEDTVTDAAGIGNNPSTSSDNEVTYDGTSPTVSIEQATGQPDPTNGANIGFEVTFSEAVSGLEAVDFAVGGTSGGFSVTDVSGGSDTFVVTVSDPGGAADGTVTLSLPADSVWDAAGNLNTESTSTDNEVTYDTTKPVTELETDISANLYGWYNPAPEITLSTGDPDDTIYYYWDSNPIEIYDTPLTAPEGDHTLYYCAADPTGNMELLNDATFWVDTVAPTGSIEINDDDFSTAVEGVLLGFDTDDDDSQVMNVRLSDDGQNWDDWQSFSTPLFRSLASGDGTKTVYAQFEDYAGNQSDVCSDEIVLDAETPSVTVEQAASQADPTASTSIEFAVTFNEPVTGLQGTDFVVGGTSTGFDIVEITGSGAEYVATVTGNGTPTDGTLTLSLPADSVLDTNSNGNTASTSTDNEVTYDSKAPTVTVEQGGAQNDPTNAKPIAFDVSFSEDVSGLTGDDFTVGGTATGFSVNGVSGSGDTYEVTVTGASTTDGTVTLSLPAGRVVDAAGNSNAASTSADNAVSFDSATAAVDDLHVATFTNDMVGIAWSAASDPNGIDGYRVWIGDDAPVTTAETSHEFTGLAASTAYTFHVQAIDGLGNISADSAITQTTGSSVSSASIDATGTQSVGLTTDEGPVEVEFSNVTAPGTVYLTPDPTPPAAATGGTWLRIGAMSYQVTFSGTFTGPVTIRLPYSNLLPDTRAAAMQVRHLGTGGWETITPTVDTTNHTLTFSLTSLSPVVVVESASANAALTLTTQFKGKSSATKTYSPYYGSRITLVGTLRDSGAKAVGYKSVTLQRYLGSGKWTDVGPATESPKGTYSYTVTASSKVYYRFKVAGDSYTSAKYGSSYKLYPQPKVAITKAPSSIKKNQSFTIKGSLRPKHAKGTKLYVYFYKYSGGKYRYQYRKVVRVTSASTSSVFSYKAKIAKTGTWRVRVYSPADASHAKSYSAYKRIRVR